MKRSMVGALVALTLGGGLCFSNAAGPSVSDDPLQWDAPAAGNAGAVVSFQAEQNLRRVAQILRQRPLPPQAQLIEQLRPIMRELDGQLKDPDQLFPDANGPMDHAYLLENAADLFHVAADIFRLQSTDPTLASAVAALIRQNAPHLGSALQGMSRRFTVINRADVAKEEIQTIRAQIELYSLQHLDHRPDLSQGWKQMTGKTDEHGNPTSAGPYGPYLNSDPVNPLTGKGRVQIIELKNPSAVPQDGYVGFDFVYDRNSGHIWITDGAGKLVMGDRW